MWEEHARLTLLVIIPLKPLRTEQRPRELAVPTLDDERLPLLDHLVPHKLLEFDLPDLGSGDALDPFKVRGPIDQAMQVEIWWDRVEFGLGMRRDTRHLEAGGRARGRGFIQEEACRGSRLGGAEGRCDCATRWRVRTSQRMFGAPFLNLRKWLRKHEKRARANFPARLQAVLTIQVEAGEQCCLVGKAERGRLCTLWT